MALISHSSEEVEQGVSLLLQLDTGLRREVEAHFLDAYLRHCCCISCAPLIRENPSCKVCSFLNTHL